EAEAHRQQVAASFMSLQAQVINQVQQAGARYHSAIAELADADELLALSQRAFHAAQRAFEVGEEDRLTLASAKVQSAESERSRLDALRKAQSALGALEDALQRPVDSAFVLPDATRAPRDQSGGGAKS